jgi:upstream activation factor subunit UAF30
LVETPREKAFFPAKSEEKRHFQGKIVKNRAFSLDNSNESGIVKTLLNELIHFTGGPEMAKAKKKATKKVAKKATKKAAKKTASKRKPGAAFMRPLELSDKLAEVLGPKALPRTEVVKKLWVYIKKNNLQDPKNKRNIKADAKLKAVFGKDTVNMFEMTKLISKHLK